MIQSVRNIFRDSRENIFFKYLRLFLKKMCQKHRDSISHIERTVNVLGEDPTKITITNASIVKKKSTLNRVYTLYLQN